MIFTENFSIPAILFFPSSLFFHLFSSLSYATSLYIIEVGAQGWNGVIRTCVEMQELDVGRRWFMI